MLDFKKSTISGIPQGSAMEISSLVIIKFDHNPSKPQTSISYIVLFLVLLMLNSLEGYAAQPLHFQNLLKVLNFPAQLLYHC